MSTQDIAPVRTPKFMVFGSRQSLPLHSQYRLTVAGKKGVVQIEYPQYSPDLNFSDFLIFPSLKLTLKRKIFDNIPDIQRNVTRLLNSIPKKTSCKISRTCMTDLGVRSYGR
ncbi:hypothetical protein TNCV_1374561 [Trichonephila clavipes]|nr:hypothetical protein TNCV_1374561 [Trichonephila clavipes]